MKTILITGAGGSYGLYLARKLESKYRIILADADQSSAGLNSKYESIAIPMGTDNNFEDVLLGIIRDKHIDYVVPCVDEELLKFWNIRKKFNQFKLILPSKEFIELCINKHILMDRLKKSPISSIPTYNLENVEFPLIAKPIQGRGSRKVHKIEDKYQLEGYFKLYNLDNKSVLLQKYFGGDEYTISVIVNNKNELVSIVPKKIILKRGITRIAISKYNEKINDVCKKIIQELKPCGPFNVQLKFYNNTPYIFEINPRLSTTSIMTDKVFGNEIELFIDNFDKENITPNFKFEENIIMARYEEAIFYKEQK